MAVAIVLFAHGARDAEWAEPARRVADAVQARAPAARVSLAFLEFMAPTLAEAVEAAAADGATEVRVVPLFLARGGHLKRDVPALVEAARARHPGCRIELLPPVGEDRGVVDAMAAYAIEAGR